MSDDKIHITYGNATEEILDEIQNPGQDEPTPVGSVRSAETLAAAEPSGGPGPEDDEAPLPVVPPEYVHVDQESVNAVLAEQAERLAQPAGNVDFRGAPHFLRNVKGEEVCGTDGRPWPCETWQSLGQPVVQEATTPAAQLLPTMAEAARAAGMDLDEFEARLRQTRGQ